MPSVHFIVPGTKQFSPLKQRRVRYGGNECLVNIVNGGQKVAKFIAVILDFI